jgi:hypothetical protein
VEVRPCRTLDGVLQMSTGRLFGKGRACLAVSKSIWRGGGRRSVADVKKFETVYARYLNEEVTEKLWTKVRG